MKKLRLTLTITFAICLLMAAQCDKFNRALAALDTAPGLIDSFSNGSDQERAQLKRYFSDAANGLRAYKSSRDTGDWNAFVAALDNIATAHLGDSKGKVRIEAIVSLVRVIFGIQGAHATASRGAIRANAPPQSITVKDADVKRLEELMKPIQ